MRICIAQTKSIKGKIQENINHHLEIIKRAIKLNADLIIFPELSITNYEPKLAEELATEIEDPIFNPFQDLSDQGKITIGIGMPTMANNGINISMLIFQPNEKRTIQTKYILHADELPYYASGDQQSNLRIKGLNIGQGICYETLQREHFIKTKAKGAEVYIASVSKPDRGVDKAYMHFPSIAKEFKTPILMANAVGHADNFLCTGHSSVWNCNGELMGQLDKENEGVSIYDTENGLTEKVIL